MHVITSLTVSLTVILLFITVSSAIDPAIFTIDPHEIITFRELIESHGFILQEHHVLTADGYVLTISRVVPPDYDPTTYNVGRKPVIVMHGIFTDASFYYFGSPFVTSNTSRCGDNFGFCALLTGRYDLWMPNNRGNGMSDIHLRYTTKDKEFWRFSFDHMAEFDLPPIIDYIRQRTGHKTLAYVGYSQGCSQMFALLSLRPQYANIIRPFIAWAPAVFIGRADSLIGVPLRTIWPIANPPGQFLIGNSKLKEIFHWQLCKTTLGMHTCNLLLDQIFGASNLNVTRIPTYANFAPSPASNWQVAHFGQNGASGRFRRFLYPSTEENVAKYGQPTPPDYPLQNIPRGYKIIIMYGRTDAIVTPPDVQQLIRLLRRNGVDVSEYLVPSPKWSHADYLIGMGAGRVLNPETIKYLDLYAWN